jgi:hypothetical protein
MGTRAPQRIADLQSIVTTATQRRAVLSYRLWKQQEVVRLAEVEKARDVMAIQVLRLRESGLSKVKIMVLTGISGTAAVDAAVERGRTALALRAVADEDPVE